MPGPSPLIPVASVDGVFAFFGAASFGFSSTGACFSIFSGGGWTFGGGGGGSFGGGGGGNCTRTIFSTFRTGALPLGFGIKYHPDPEHEDAGDDQFHPVPGNATVRSPSSTRSAVEVRRRTSGMVRVTAGRRTRRSAVGVIRGSGLSSFWLMNWGVGGGCYLAGLVARPICEMLSRPSTSSTSMMVWYWVALSPRTTTGNSGVVALIAPSCFRASRG